MSDNSNWWEHFEARDYLLHVHEPETTALGALRATVLTNPTSKNAVYSLERRGMTDINVSARVEELGGRAVAYNLPCKGPADLTRIDFVWPDGFAVVSYRGDERDVVHLEAYTTNKALADDLAALAALFRPVERQKNSILVIALNQHGRLAMNVIRNASVPLERANYSEDVLTKFDHVKSDLLSPAPSGRLTIVEGPPGVGKTFLLRGLIGETNGPVFVVIPPGAVAELARPALLTVLLEAKRKKVGSMVLILEDADAALVERRADNMSAISALLNMSDGILGSLIDIRIIATTNAKAQHIEIEEALLRRGRLSARIQVKKMTVEAARVRVEQLTGKSCQNVFGQKSVSLAEMYGAARDRGWMPSVPGSIDGEDAIDCEYCEDASEAVAELLDG